MSGDGKREVVVYKADWCSDSRRAVSWLTEHEIPFEAIDIDEDEGASERVMELNGGNRSTPTILIDGEHVATEPSRGELAALFGIEEEPRPGLFERLRGDRD